MQDTSWLILNYMLTHQSLSAWDQASRYLSETAFHDELGTLWKLMRRMYKQYGSLSTLESIALAAQSTKDQTVAIALTSSLLSLKATREVSEAEFSIALELLIQENQVGDFTTILSTGLEIAARGMYIGNKNYKGISDASTWVESALRNNKTVDIPNDLVDVYDHSLLNAELQSIRSGNISLVKSGIQKLDNIFGGMADTDLMVVEGYLGEGKSQMLVNIAYDAAVNQAKNVLFVTTETSVQKIRRRFISRATMPYPINIPYTELKYAKFTHPEAEAQLKSMLTDFNAKRKDKKMGTFTVWSFSGTFSSIEPRLIAAIKEYGSIDLLAVDYLTLTASSYDRINIIDVIVEAKKLAVKYAVPVLTPWQTSLDAWTKARKVGHYDKASMAESSEIERSADIVLTMLRNIDDPNSLACRFTKLRDEAEGDTVELYADYRTSYIGSTAPKTSFTSKVTL